MGKIYINNLGPIKEYESETNERAAVLIGEQASGKSTLAKAVFFCKSVGDEFKKFLLDSENLTPEVNVKAFTNFKKKLRTKFMEYFGTTKHLESLEVRYQFDSGESMSITLDDRGYAKIFFSKPLRAKCEAVIDEVTKRYNDIHKGDNLSMDNFNLWSNQAQQIGRVINHKVNSIFDEDYVSIYIPAGRSLLATNPDFFSTAAPNKYDIIMKDFIERILVLRNLYNKRLNQIVEDKKKLSSEEIDFGSVNKAIDLIRDILKGEYISDRSGEKIYYDNDSFVKLIQASSGQQEVLWILLLIFSVILNRQKVFMVIEEPEAHLFPNSQKKIIDLFALMMNATGSSVIITTHSPYILASMNLSLFSGTVENKEIKDEIVDIDYRLKINEIKALLLKNGWTVDLVDEESSMIDTSQIDTISESLNSQIDLLLQKEITNG